MGRINADSFTRGMRDMKQLTSFRGRANGSHSVVAIFIDYSARYLSYISPEQKRIVHIGRIEHQWLTPQKIVCRLTILLEGVRARQLWVIKCVYYHPLWELHHMGHVSLCPRLDPSKQPYFLYTVPHTVTINLHTETAFIEWRKGVELKTVGK